MLHLTRSDSGASSQCDLAFVTSLEIVGVFGYVALPFFWALVISKDRRNRTLRLASSAINAFFRVDVKLILTLVYTVHRADIDAASVQFTDAGLSDDICHKKLRLYVDLGKLPECCLDPSKLSSDECQTVRISLSFSHARGKRFTQ